MSRSQEPATADTVGATLGTAAARADPPGLAGDHAGAAPGGHAEAEPAAAAAPPARHRDVVPEGLRHNSEVAAELGSRLKAAVMERLHLGHRTDKAPREREREQQQQQQQGDDWPLA